MLTLNRLAAAFAYQTVAVGTYQLGPGAQRKGPTANLPSLIRINTCWFSSEPGIEPVSTARGDTYQRKTPHRRKRPAAAPWTSALIRINATSAPPGQLALLEIELITKAEVASSRRRPSSRRDFPRSKTAQGSRLVDKIIPRQTINIEARRGRVFFEGEGDRCLMT